jgi:hypothetical protein
MLAKQDTLQDQIRDVLQASSSSDATGAQILPLPDVQTQTPQLVRDAEFIEIRARRFNEQACDPWCKCACHAKKDISSPHFLESIIDRLLLGYTGFIKSSRPCTRLACRRRSDLQGQIRYRFPVWFLSWNITAFIASRPAQTPEMLLRVSRVRPYGDTDLFRFSTSGDVQRIHALFMSHQASPLDVQPDGRTALHVGLLILAVSRIADMLSVLSWDIQS